MSAGVLDRAPVVPFAPSALDRLAARIDRLPVHGWWVYPVAVALLAAVMNAVIWAQGIRPLGEPEPGVAAFVFYAPYTVFVVHFLGRSADRAMLAFSRALEMPPAEIEERRYRLRSLPAGGLLPCALIGGAMGLLVVLTQGPAQLAAFGRDAATAELILVPFAVAGYAGAVVCAWITLRMLRQVTELHRLARIDLFDDAPLYAFSGLTMRVGLVWAAVGYYSLTVSSAFVANNPAALSVTLGNFAVAVVCFVGPLLGLHDRLVHEKARLEREADARVAALGAQLYGRVDRGELGGVKEVTDAIAGVVAVREQVLRTRTWPWPPQVLRQFVTALVLPVIVFLITRVISAGLSWLG